MKLKNAQHYKNLYLMKENENGEKVNAYKEDLTKLVEIVCETHLEKIDKYLSEAIKTGARVEKNTSGEYLNIKLDSISDKFNIKQSDFDFTVLKFDSNIVKTEEDFYNIYLIDYLENICDIRCFGTVGNSDLGKLLGNSNRYCITIPLDQFRVK